MKKDTIIGLLLMALMVFVFVSSFARIGEMVNDTNKLKYELQRELNSNVEWLFRCDDYVSAFYNCPNELKFINMSGKYCNNTIVCETKYIIKEHKP